MPTAKDTLIKRIKTIEKVVKKPPKKEKEK